MTPREHLSAYSVLQASARTGLSRTMIHALIKRGDLQARKAGRRTLILADALDRYLRQLPMQDQGGR
ncbi:helix-turn-helix domain-containing protein [Roseomonas sp. SSH11]|uniref:Helix-turn-helix domain-containing protein n=1 Tax=Pararoseomonas baculiformis TaxID=2820812 RepID=A0ABS4AL50_9PROT|nr:helix-turn-helix domain-containing protein [Pararoseomonas baculiformis]